MTLFALAAAALVVAALLFVVPPLLRDRRLAGGVTRDAVNVSVYRDQLRELEADLKAGTLSQDRYEEARNELERRLLDDASAGGETAVPAVRSRYAALVVGLAVPLLAVALYLGVGTPDALRPERVAEEQGHGLDRQQVEAMVERLARKMREDPNADPEGWIVLARSYNAMGRFDDAVGAYKAALKSAPPDARLLADYADALAMAQGRTLQGEPEKLIAQALELDPENVKALALAGTAAFDRKDYPAAVTHWEKALAVVPPDSPMAQSMTDSIAEARSLGGLKPAARPVAKAEPAAPSAGGGRVSGEVRLDPALASRIAPTDTVFIFARPADGARMPLAVLRKQASELPAKFTLDDSMAMTPQGKLSAFPQVVVSARVSKSGNAVPKSGDLEGASKPLKVGAADAVVVIDRVVQ